MNIRDFLQIILDSDYSVYASGNIDSEQVRVSVDSFNLSLCIKPASSTRVIIELNYLYQKKPQGVRLEPTLEVEIEEIKEFMDAISQKELIEFYEAEKWTRDNIEESKKLIEVFKNVLAEKDIPKQYSWRSVTNEIFTKGVIAITENDTGAIHLLDFKQFFSDYGERKVRVCTDNLKITIKVNSNHSKLYNFKIPTDFKFKIPAYDIVNYPLLVEQNDFKKSFNHTTFDSWLNDIIHHPYAGKTNFPEILSKYLLKENLDKDLENEPKNNNSKIKL